MGFYSTISLEMFNELLLCSGTTLRTVGARRSYMAGAMATTTGFRPPSCARRHVGAQRPSSVCLVGWGYCYRKIIDNCACSVHVL